MAQSIDLAGLKRLPDAGAQLVEVPLPAEYAEKHPPHAVTFLLKTLNAENATQRDRAKSVVVYCFDSL